MLIAGHTDDDAEIQLPPLSVNGTYFLARVSEGGLLTEEPGNEDLFIVSPNPSAGKFIVRSSKTISSLEIRNSIGENVFSAKINSGKTEIDLHNCPKGIYLVDVFYGSEKKSRKIILE
jgi:hypothetical protein